MNTVHIPEHLIQVGVVASDWRGAVILSGELLVASGNVEMRYVHAMIDSIETHGPYIVIAPGVAMPHARPEDGVIEKGISVTLLANPVMFGPDPVHEVKLIICLAATDNTSHLHLLQFIAEVISEEKRLNRLMHAITTDELKQCFQLREEK